MQLTDLKGVGKVTLQKLYKLGIYTVEDVLDFLPKCYWDMTKEGNLLTAEQGDYVLLKGTMHNITKVANVRKGLSFFRALLKTQNFEVKLVWFNAPYLRANLKEDNEYTVFGKISKKYNTFELINPSFESEDGERLSGIVSIYPTKGLIQQATMRKIVQDALDNAIIQPLVDNESLMPLMQAYKDVHIASSVQQAYIARRRLTLEELTAKLCAFRLSKNGSEKIKQNKYLLKAQQIDDIKNKLPYKLSLSQSQCIEDIICDLKSDRSMNRMILGDVGSGKTVVALLTMAYAVRCGYQCVLMAPTEILAKQHFANAQNLFEGFGIRCEFLSGSMSASEKKIIYKKAENGETDIIIGTHAVISDKITFKNLSYIVIDELHKFGVRQKSMLEKKAVGVDVAIMSATPIPRVLALGEYGDVDISFVESRKSMEDYPKTFVVNDKKYDDMLNFIKERVMLGEQAYIVCPLVEDSEGIEISSAKTVYETLKKSVFKDMEIALIYGSMKDNEKEKIMNDFYINKTKVIVATSVVEVGIDSKNATVIAILNADRFGLASLHQLRGRVGRRDGMKSYCFLHTDKEDENERLKTLCMYYDGFSIAEKDAQLRGYGDFLGLRQSGGAGKVLIDKKLLMQSKDLCDIIFNGCNKELLSHKKILGYLDVMKTVSLT